MVRTCGGKDRARGSNENMENGSEWTPKCRKIKTEAERCYTKIYEGDVTYLQREETQHRSSCIMETRRADKGEEEDYAIPILVIKDAIIGPIG